FIGEPAGHQRGDGQNKEGESGNDGHGLDGEVAHALKIDGQPSNEEIPEVVVGEESGEGAPRGTLAEDLEDAGAGGGLTARSFEAVGELDGGITGSERWIRFS